MTYQAHLSLRIKDLNAMGTAQWFVVLQAMAQLPLQNRLIRRRDFRGAIVIAVGQCDLSVNYEVFQFISPVLYPWRILR